MNDIASILIIVAELAFLVYAVNWLAKELKRWKSN